MMDEVKPSVNQQLEHNDTPLEPQVQAFTEVLSSEGLHPADVVPDPEASPRPLSRTVALSRDALQGDAPNPPQVVPEPLSQAVSESLVAEPLPEAVSEIGLTPEFHDQLAQAQYELYNIGSSGCACHRLGVVAGRNAAQ